MTLEEIQILKQSMLDGIEVYVKRMINVATFNKIETGSIISSDGDNGYTVKIKDKNYSGIKALGNQKMGYTTDDIVVLCIPNNQYSQMFILGALKG